MNATVSTRKRAWQLADKLFPTDYMKDEHDSLRAGYPVFNTTSTDDKYTGFHISDLNTALELNMGAETIRINIQDQEAEIKNNFDKLLQYVADKRKSAELHERQKYNYYCDRQAGCWNWTKEQDEAYQKEWDDIIIQMHALKDLENAMNLARTKKVGWNPTALKTPCETDCSAMMSPVLKCAGISVSKDIYTGNMVNAIMATGEFEKLTGSKYTDTGDNLMTGDISVAAGKHTIMALENGCNVSGGNGSGNGSSNNPAVPYGTAKTATFTGYVNTGALNVRKQPDPDADKLVSYPCIKQNTEVGVCGSAKAPNGALWYYIYIDGAKGKKYGYVNARYITAK